MQTLPAAQPVLAEPEDSAPARQSFLARQPILRADGAPAAYELLFRGSASAQHAQFGRAVQASASVVLTALNEIGLAALTGGKPAYINIDREFLLTDALEILPPEAVVLELLETIEADSEVVKRCAELKKRGYRIALDDFERSEANSQLLQFADVVKIDVLGREAEQIAKAARDIERVTKKAGHKVMLLAEKVEYSRQVEACRSCGFALYQGYFFARPQTIPGKTLSPEAQSVARLISMLSLDEEDAKLVGVLKNSPGLIVRLLRLVNSVGVSGAHRKIETLPHALRLLGRKPLTRWLQLLMLAGSGSPQAGVLLEMACARARVMEGLSRQVFPEQPGEADCAFLTGLFSLLDVVFGMPLAEVLGDMAVPEPVRLALTAGGDGPLDRMLVIARHLERGAAEEAIACAQSGGWPVDEIVINQTQRDGLVWSAEVARAVNA